jgi:hypothetical protein
VITSILCNTVLGIFVNGYCETMLVVEVVFLGRVIHIPVGAIEIENIRMSNEEIVTNYKF